MKKEGFINQRNRISISLLLSYLVILIIPFIALLIIYSAASKLLMEVQIGRVSNSLANTATNLDRQLRETYNVGRYISNDPKVLKLCRMQGDKVKKVDYYDFYEMTTNFPNYNLTNQIIKNVYMFFREQDYVVKIPVLVPAKENAYQTLDFAGTLSYEDCIRRYTEDYFEGTILPIKSNQSEDDYFIMLQSFPYGTIGQPFGVTVIVLNQKLILKQMKSVLDGAEGITFISDEEGNIIRSVQAKGGSLKTEEILLKPEAQPDVFDTKIDGKSYVACKRKLESAPWYVVSMISRSELQKRIGWMRYAIIMVCGLSICVALSICLLKWKSNARIVNRYCDFKSAMNWKEENYLSFWKSLPLFLDSVEDLQAEMKEQKIILRSEILRKILYNGYHSKDDMVYDMRLAQLDMAAGYYSVAVFKTDDMHSLEINYSKTAGTFIQEYLHKNSSIRYVSYEINNQSAAMVLMSDQQGLIEKYGDIFYQLIVMLQETYHVQVFIGLSDETDSLMKLHQAYFQALKVSDYLRYYDLRIPMTERELPANTNNFYFPVELELRFIKAILRGKVTELNKIIQEIQEENMAKRKLNIAMLSHLTDMIRCTGIRAFKEAGLEQLDPFIKKLENSEKIEEIFRNVMEAKQIIEEDEKGKQLEMNEQLKNQIDQYLQDNYHKYDFNLTILSEYLKMPENKVYQEFKNCYGVSMSEYLETMRMNKACQLLREHIIVKDVADMVGYGSDYSFRRAFKRVIGVSPSSYADFGNPPDNGEKANRMPSL